MCRCYLYLRVGEGGEPFSCIMKGRSCFPIAACPLPLLLVQKQAWQKEQLRGGGFFKVISSLGARNSARALAVPRGKQVGYPRCGSLSIFHSG